MTVLLIALLFIHSHTVDHALDAWTARSILCLNISEELKLLPWTMRNAAAPEVDERVRMLPLGYYEEADRERNRRLYGYDSVYLDPTMVVLHYTVVDDVEVVFDIFNRPSQLPVGNQTGVTSLISVHYMVDVDGTVYQLAREDRTTSGTYGVDHVAIAIELVAADEQALLERPMQLLSAFYLVDSILKRHDLPVWRVFSHQEVASGKLLLSEYTDIADTESPYCYPEPHFRYDPGPQVMAWCREFLLRQRGAWDEHPASMR